MQLRYVIKKNYASSWETAKGKETHGRPPRLMAPSQAAQFQPSGKILYSESIHLSRQHQLMITWYRCWRRQTATMAATTTRTRTTATKSHQSHSGPSEK